MPIALVAAPSARAAGPIMPVPARRVGGTDPIASVTRAILASPNPRALVTETTDQALPPLVQAIGPIIARRNPIAAVIAPIANVTAPIAIGMD